MSRLTLRLPETLHQNLVSRAEAEGVSLNQMIVYLLTRITTTTELESQKQAFVDLLRQYSAEEAEGALEEMLASRRPRA